MVQGSSFNIGTKCNCLTQQFIGISTTIDTWATCFNSIESSSGPQRLQIQFLQGSQVHCGIPQCAEITWSQVRAVRWVGKRCDIMLSQKFPQRMMCDLVHCRVEGTTCLQFHVGHAQLCFLNARVPVGKMFDSQSVRVAQTPCELFPLNQKK